MTCVSFSPPGAVRLNVVMSVRCSHVGDGAASGSQSFELQKCFRPCTLPVFAASLSEASESRTARPLREIVDRDPGSRPGKA